MPRNDITQLSWGVSLKEETGTSSLRKQKPDELGLLAQAN